jgi:hypothetical protein
MHEAPAGKTSLVTTRNSRRLLPASHLAYLLIYVDVFLTVRTELCCFRL